MAATMESMVDYSLRKRYPMPIQIDFVHSLDSVDLAVHRLLEHNESLSKSTKVRFTEFAYQINESFARDPGCLKAKELDSFISYCKLASGTVDGLHPVKNFGIIRKYNLFKEAVSNLYSWRIRISFKQSIFNSDGLGLKAN